MTKNISKTEAKEKILDFFMEAKSKTPTEVKKIKNLAANQKLPLGKHKESFCKKCFMPFQSNEKIRIKKGFKTIECKNCGEIKRIKL